MNRGVNRVDYLGLTSFPNPEDWKNLPCDDLAKLIDAIIEVLKKRFDDMENDTCLWNNPNTLPRSKGGMGTWEGHQQAFRDTQAQLKKIVDHWRNRDDCKDPVWDELWHWMHKDAPDKPLRARFRPLPRVSCTDGQTCGTGSVDLPSEQELVPLYVVTAILLCGVDGPLPIGDVAGGRIVCRVVEVAY